MAGVILAIFLQRKELQLQRRELELTPGELNRSAEAQERQTTIQLKTAYLNALSSLISHHNMTARDLSTSNASRRKAALAEQEKYVQGMKSLLDELELPMEMSD